MSQYSEVTLVLALALTHTCVQYFNTNCLSTLGYPPYRGGGLTNRLSNLLLFLYFSMRLSALSLIAEAYIAALLVRLPLH